MKKQILYSTIFILVFMIINSCKTEGPRTINAEFAKYISAFTYGNIPSSSDIIIELNYDMPAVEINKEIEEDLFEFSPQIKGKAYWTSSRTIKFVPEPGQLKQGETYDAWFKLNKLIEVEKILRNFISISKYLNKTIH